MRQFAFAACAAALGFAAPAFAQESEPDIVVTATRLEEMIRAFVGEVSVEQQAEGQIARWDGTICPQIAGLQARHAQFIADRLSQRAYQIGLVPGGPNCRANVLIFVTPDADRFAGELTSRFPIVFDPRESNMHQSGDEQLQHFISSDAAVRWWHVSQTVSMEGQIVRNTDSRWGPRGLQGLSVVRTGITSRLQRPTHQDFNRAVIIVDAAQASGVRLDSLADYVSMVTLAQLNPNADTSENDTILNLFGRGPNRPPGMTTWDVSYLEGLYGGRPNAWTARQQEADISRRMRTTELDDEYLDE